MTAMRQRYHDRPYVPKIPPGTICGYCFEKLATGYDHILPWSYRHDNRESNLYPACIRCNGVAGNLIFETLDAKREYIREWLARKLHPHLQALRMPNRFKGRELLQPEVQSVGMVEETPKTEDQGETSRNPAVPLPILRESLPSREKVAKVLQPKVPVAKLEPFKPQVAIGNCMNCGSYFDRSFKFWNFCSSKCLHTLLG